jgi:hypothetical protein
VRARRGGRCELCCTLPSFVPFELGWLAHVADEGGVGYFFFFFVCWAVNSLDVAFFDQGQLEEGAQVM